MSEPRFTEAGLQVMRGLFERITPDPEDRRRISGQVLADLAGQMSEEQAERLDTFARSTDLSFTEELEGRVRQMMVREGVI